VIFVHGRTDFVDDIGFGHPEHRGVGVEEGVEGGLVLFLDGLDDLAGSLLDFFLLGVDEIAEEEQTRGEEERDEGAGFETGFLAGVAGEPEGDRDDDQQTQEPVRGVEEEVGHIPSIFQTDRSDNKSVGGRLLAAALFHAIGPGS
jgi:hypothetical protein